MDVTGSSGLYRLMASVVTCAEAEYFFRRIDDADEALYVILREL
jgi:hypothetical protein